jgi:ubiquinol-cytochrome c reductase iron-sulfur subunit
LFSPALARSKIPNHLQDEGAMNRRKLLNVGLAAVAGLGAYASSIPFVKSFLPSAKAKALGTPVEFDLAQLKPGEVRALEYRGRVMLVLRRTAEMINNLRATNLPTRRPGDAPDPPYVSQQLRSTNPEFLIVEGVCTHLGCVPRQKSEAEGKAYVGQAWHGGFICPCHGSAFDVAGRVVRGPAPSDLAIPPHRFVSASRVVIGESPKPS